MALVGSPTSPWLGCLLSAYRDCCCCCWRDGWGASRFASSVSEPVISDDIPYPGGALVSESADAGGKVEMECGVEVAGVQVGGGRGHRSLVLATKQ